MTRLSVSALFLTLLLSLTSCTQTPPAAQAQPDTRAADEKAVNDFETAWSPIGSRRMLKRSSPITPTMQS
jgi:starvation-inducible outer membrane lipoprotein